jgi:hypothetical protein
MHVRSHDYIIQQVLRSNFFFDYSKCFIGITVSLFARTLRENKYAQVFQKRCWKNPSPIKNRHSHDDWFSLLEDQETKYVILSLYTP